jgi:hypothetical protein
MVAFWSLSYSLKSERDEILNDVTRGPPLLPVQWTYSLTTLVSKTPRVVSKLLPPFVLVGVTAVASTTAGKPPYSHQFGEACYSNLTYMVYGSHGMSASSEANCVYLVKACTFEKCQRLIQGRLWRRDASGGAC